MEKEKLIKEAEDFGAYAEYGGRFFRRSEG